MKKIQYAIMALTVAFAGSVFAQTSSLSEPDASNIGNDSARQALREVSVERFEREGSWNVHISPDYGVIQGRLFEGSPAAKEELNDKDNQQIEDTKVLGVKVEFFRRGINSFYITSARPIPIEGVTLKSGWDLLNSVAGRSSQQQFLHLQIANMVSSSRASTMVTSLVFAS